MAVTNNSIAHGIPNITMELVADPNRVSDQEAVELHRRLAQLAPTTRQPYQPGAGPDLRPDILIQFILEHTGSGAIEALAGAAALKLVKQGIQVLLAWMQHPTTAEQQAPTTSIILLNSPVITQNVTITTGALTPDLLAQVPGILADLPSYLHQPPLARHTVKYLRIPAGFLEIPTQHQDPTAPLRYWTIQSPSIRNGIAVFDTHTGTLITPYAAHNTAENRDRPHLTLISVLKRLWRRL